MELPSGKVEELKGKSFGKILSLQPKISDDQGAPSKLSHSDLLYETMFYICVAYFAISTEMLEISLGEAHLRS